MSADLDALKRRLEGKIALAKTYSDMHALLSLRDAERLRVALERIPELERRLDEAIDQNMRQASRLERVEAAAVEALAELEQGEVNSAEKALRIGLAPCAGGQR